MTFSDSTFPNETHYETLLNGRQRFGNRSASMFFVRPARHIACPQRLKYIHDIKTGYIPYVEDSTYPNRPSHKNVLQKMNDDTMTENNGLGLYNSAGTWRQELMELAQQVKSSLKPPNEQEQSFRPIRTSCSNKRYPKRSNSLVSSCIFEENTDEQHISKRLLSRRASLRQQQSRGTTSKPANGKSEAEQTPNDGNQDAGIWLIPILCYILQIDNIFEAQDWLANANPTEKRLAMELISRTMHDMQNHDNEHLSDVSTVDFSSVATGPTPNINNVYWPFKIWQRQEKERQQQMHNSARESKPSFSPFLPLSTNENGETCERATSPLRMVTPAKRSLSVHHRPTSVITTIIERSPTRNFSDQGIPNVVIRQNQNQKTDLRRTVEKRPSSRVSTRATVNENDRPSRRSYRVTTSLNSSIDEEAELASLAPRGKTPLI